MIDWIKRNKLTLLLVVVIALLLIRNNQFIPLERQATIPSVMMETDGVGGAAGPVNVKSIPVPVVDQYTPTRAQNRLVVQESSMSMVVSDVRKTSDEIVAKAQNLGGYMVDSSVTNPEEAPFATVSIRVPADQLKNALDYFRSLAVKVTSENIQGTDVTDQYTDITARLETLDKTRAKFEEIMDKASQVQDILTVQRELVNLQDQIDSLKGQQQYLEQTAKLAKITVYLSTDEFALPYVPTNNFRPEVIFKEAVRSLVSNVRNFAGMLIWVVVYGVVWIPLLIISYLILRKRKQNIS